MYLFLLDFVVFCLIFKSIIKKLDFYQSFDLIFLNQRYIGEVSTFPGMICVCRHSGVWVHNEKLENMYKYKDAFLKSIFTF